MHDMATEDPSRRIGGTAYLRRQDLAERLGISIRTIERWAVHGDGPPMVAVGNMRFYPEADLEDWLRRRLIASTSAATTKRRA